MPTLEDLDALKTQINQLGNELGLLAERGETLEDVVPPEASIDPDLDRMLDDAPSAGVDEMEALLGTYAEDLGEPTPDDTDAFDGLDDLEDLEGLEGLDDLDGGFEPDISEAADDTEGPDDRAAAPPPETGPEDEDFNLDDLLGDTGPDMPSDESADIAGLDDFTEFTDTAEVEAAPESPVESPETGIDDIIDLDDADGFEAAMFDADPTDDAENLDNFTELDEIGDLSDADASAGETESPDDDAEVDFFDGVSGNGLEDFSGESPADLDDFQMSDADIEDDGDFSLDDLDLGEAEETVSPDIPDAVEAPDTDTGDDFDLDDLSFDEDGFGDESDDGISEAGETDFSDLSDSEAAGEPDLDENDDSESRIDGDIDSGALDDINLDDLNFDADSADENPVDVEEAGEAEEDAGLSLDDLSFDEPASDVEAESSDGLEEDAGVLEELGDLDDLDDVDDLGEMEPGDEALTEDDAVTEVPDVDAAMDNLGDLDALSDGGPDELFLDDDLNFDEELGADVLSDIKEAGDDTQQFSMDDFGEAYNFKEGESGIADSLGVDLEQLEQSLDEATDDDTKPFSLEDEDFAALLRTLAHLPRNLKVAIEELLADERRNPEDLNPIINALIDGESAKSLVGRFKAITKRKIELPRSYEKRSGLALEARRAALAYRLIREGWPVIRLILLIIAVAWSLGAAVFMWVYRPMKAEQLYRQGLDAVAEDEIDRAVERFYDAWDGWPLFAAPDEGDRIGDSPVVVKGWKNKDRWLDYARSLRRRKHWNDADQFYAGYLSVKPDDKDVRLEYSEFLSGVLGRYERAIGVLDGAPLSGRGTPDRDYMLAAGDVFLRWAEDDPAKYEDARYRYAKVLETSRNDERAILSMMRYHLRLADEEEIETLLPIFDTEMPGRTDEPVLAAEVFAGLGDWHLVRGRPEEARRFINLALAAHPSSPEPHYIDARYWRSLGGRPNEELEAYKRTLVALDARESLDRRGLEMRILSLGGMGRLYYARAVRLRGDPQAAAEARSLATGNYSKALDLYEDALQRNQIGASPVYGQLYLEIGDVLYDGAAVSGDLTYSLAGHPELLAADGDRYAELSRAEQYYNKAETLFDTGRSGSKLPDESLYRRAYARYALGRDGALVDFHRVARRRPLDYEIRLALGTVLLASEDYEASRSQYSRAIGLLDEELRRTGGVLNPQEREAHEELLLRYIIAWNNLGVGRARSAARGGGEDDYAAALSAFTMASEYMDEVSDGMTGLNSRGVVGLRDSEERRIIVESETDQRNFLKEKGTFPYRNRLRLLGLESAEAGEDTYLMYVDIPSDILGAVRD